MRAPGWVASGVVLAAFGATATAEPKPKPVDIKPYKDKAQVFQDAHGGTYVVAQGDETVVFYGTGKLLYQQRIQGRGSDGDAHTWSISLDTPRIADLRYGSIDRKPDGTYLKSCDGKDDAVLSELVGDKAKAVLEKSQFLTSAMLYVPVLAARDDAGIYYYVDRLAKEYGGKGYRVFIGKKGAMKLMPLTDVAVDSAGEVYATKTGDLRLVHGHDAIQPGAQWVKGGKAVPLIQLDVDVNSPLIFSEFGVYTFLGTICDNVSY